MVSLSVAQRCLLSRSTALYVVLLSASLHGQSVNGYKTLYSFNAPGNLEDGAEPEATLVRDSEGNLYGTTFFGGGGTGCERNYGGCGVVFEIRRNGTESTLHSFSGTEDGANPTGNLTLDSTGNLYGTTPYGGRFGRGVVFRITPSGEETILHHFEGGRDGANPAAGLVQDSAGDLYGTTQYGGRGCYGQGCGTVFRLSPTGEEKVLYRFRDAEDGASPRGSVALDETGGVYGVAWLGGAFGFGTAFSIQQPQTAAEQLSSGLNLDNEEALDRSFRLLHTFTNSDDGANPIGGLVRDNRGYLYGTTSAGGQFTVGTLFELNPRGQLRTLYAFTGGADGASPYGNLILDPAGSLYGASSAGGSSNYAGVVFEVTDGAFQTLYQFAGDATDGANPMAGVVLDPQGNLYGTLMQAGANGWGSVFEIAHALGSGSTKANRISPQPKALSKSDLETFNAAQLPPLCRPRLSAPITVATPRQRLDAGNKAAPPLTDGFDWPDAQLSAVRDGAEYLFFSIDAGLHARQTSRGHGQGNNNYGGVVMTKGTLDNPLGSAAPVDVSIQPNPDPHVNPHNCDPAAHPESGCYTYIGGGPVYVVPPGQVGAGNWLLVYHAEYSSPNYYINGLAVSADKGLHWTDIGEILRANMPFSYSGPSEPFAVGDGPLVISTDRKYFYLYFQDWLKDGSQTNVSIERAAIDDVLQAAFGATVPHAAPFKKFYNGEWNQPGLGGLSSDLIPQAHYGGGLNVAYNDSIHRYQMVNSDSQNYSYAESPDGLTWTDTTFLGMLGDYPNLAGYSGPIGLGKDPSVLGNSFYVYYTEFKGPWPSAQSVKRFTLTCESPLTPLK